MKNRLVAILFFLLAFIEIALLPLLLVDVIQWIFTGRFYFGYFIDEFADRVVD